MLYIWLVNKSRTALLYFIIIVLVLFVIGKQVNGIRKVCIIVFLVACFIGVVASYKSVRKDMISYVEADAGIMIRFSTIKFYIGQFLEHPILGMGLISSSKDVSGWQLLYGSGGYFYRDDVGLIGLINKFRICGFIWAWLFLSKVKKKPENLIQ